MKCRRRKHIFKQLTILLIRVQKIHWLNSYHVRTLNNKHFARFWKKTIWFHNSKLPSFKICALCIDMIICFLQVLNSVFTFIRKSCQTRVVKSVRNVIGHRWKRQKRLIDHIRSEHVYLNWNLNLVCWFHRQRRTVTDAADCLMVYWKKTMTNKTGQNFNWCHQVIIIQIISTLFIITIKISRIRAYF